VLEGLRRWLARRLPGRARDGAQERRAGDGPTPAPPAVPAPRSVQRAGDVPPSVTGHLDTRAGARRGAASRALPPPPPPPRPGPAMAAEALRHRAPVRLLFDDGTEADLPADSATQRRVAYLLRVMLPPPPPPGR
jgi:hypothetical protein